MIYGANTGKYFFLQQCTSAPTVILGPLAPFICCMTASPH